MRGGAVDVEGLDEPVRRFSTHAIRDAAALIGGTRLAERRAAMPGPTPPAGLEIERHTGRKVVAFMSVNQTTPGIACELFLLDAATAGTGAAPG